MAEAQADEHEVFQRLKDDFEHYAPRCLWIRTKDQGLQRFELNDAQQILHIEAEDMLETEGHVRIIVLKGRQQGCCLAPDTPVLTADMRWISIGAVKPGMELVGVDELPRGGRMRKLKRVTVEAVARTRKPAYRITLADGRQVVCSDDHRWLTRKSQTHWQWRSIGYRVGGADLSVGTDLRSLVLPWGASTHADAWVGGMIDGEGSLDSRARMGNRLAITQRSGPVLDRLVEYGALFGASLLKDPRKDVSAVCFYAIPSIMEVMGKCRPVRFVNGDWWEGKRLPDGGAVRVVGVEALGERDLVDLQTSDQTFIANGLVSHNSTYIEGRAYWKVTHRFGWRAYILTHEADATANLFAMVSRFHDNCPDEVRPETDRDSGKELNFNRLDSGYKVGTAGTKGTGRSSTIQFFHGSEVAFWPHAETHATGVMQAVPDVPGSETEIWLESTSDGMGNYFHQTWVKAVAGVNGFRAVFIPWFLQSEYRRPLPTDDDGNPLPITWDEDELELMDLFDISPEHMLWRRQKIATLKNGADDFKREYPNTPEEAFESAGYRQLIKATDVRRACDNGRRVLADGRPWIEARGPLVLGVDPARFGDDRLSMALRQGRVAFDIVAYSHKMDQMEIVGLVRQILDAFPVDACFIDSGMGVGVIDRLHELDYSQVREVNFGSQAFNTTLYTNRRNEMWQEMAEWFEDEHVALFTPSADDIEAKIEAATMDLCGVEYKFNSRNQKVLEEKEETKKRIGVSPDMGDALALTFAEPVAEYNPPDPPGGKHQGRDSKTGY